MFIRVGETLVRAEAITAIAPSDSGSTVYAGAAAFSSTATPDAVAALIDAESVEE